MKKSEAIENHRKMWNWIAEQIKEGKCRPGRQIYLKELYIIEYFSGCTFRHNCFLCDYSHNQSGICEPCPLYWGSSKMFACEDGFYKMWRDTENMIEAYNLALIIANLPETIIGE